MAGFAGETKLAPEAGGAGVHVAETVAGGRTAGRVETGAVVLHKEANFGFDLMHAEVNQ
jgi:dihydroxyacetone kinase